MLLQDETRGEAGTRKCMSCPRTGLDQPVDKRELRKRMELGSVLMTTAVHHLTLWQWRGYREMRVIAGKCGGGE